jgi:hypothetical protein
LSQGAFSIACGFTVLFAVLMLTSSATAAPEVTAQESGITWRPCPTEVLPTRECGELSVPLDYDEPDGATITAAVARDMDGLRQAVGDGQLRVPPPGGWRTRGF